MKHMKKFRVVTNGSFFRAQVRTALFFWVDLDHNGYRNWGSCYTVSDRWMANNYIQKFKKRDSEFNAQYDGPWKASL